MNNRTRITSVKSITNAKDIADLLQEAGISSRRAKLAAGAAWKAINQEDREAKARKALAEQLQQITARLG